jgi:aryl-alcohol dehydrogenase (NADP+)
MADLIRAGKVRYFGISNFRGWRTAEIVNACIRLGLPRPIASQPYYNLLNRLPENEILPACANYGLGVVSYSPIARGVLTGKYKPGAEPDAASRAGRKDRRMMETEFRAESLEIAQRIKAHAEAKGLSAGHFAINWVLNNRLVTSVIGGPRTLEQWNDYVAAIGKPFDAEDEALVDSLVKMGHPSTPGYNDPSYPIRGRVPRSG